ncbi:MAG: DUF3501 family protein [Rhodospirillaceae bacterium]
MKRAIDKGDILPMDVYGQERKARRTEMVALKKDRRLQVGPNATLHFESFETMLYQVHEMLFTERGGDEQVLDELMAYNPLIPKGNELVATLMLEMEDPIRRAKFLAQLGGIEEHISLDFGDQQVKASWERDIDRTTPDGKTSSVHFLHFHFTPEQVMAFRQPGARIVAAIAHPNYGHMAILTEAMRESLAKDL